MARLVRRTWHGDEIQARERRATGRSLVGMGERVSNEMTRQAHVISGDLKRSIHAAKPDTMGEVPAGAETVYVTPDLVALEVGSWLPYACVENNHGGDHRFADIGWEQAKPRFPRILKRAFKEEGLA